MTVASNFGFAPCNALHPAAILYIRVSIDPKSPGPNTLISFRTGCLQAISCHEHILGEKWNAM